MMYEPEAEEALRKWTSSRYAVLEGYGQSFQVPLEPGEGSDITQIPAMRRYNGSLFISTHPAFTGTQGKTPTEFWRLTAPNFHESVRGRAEIGWQFEWTPGYSTTPWSSHIFDNKLFWTGYRPEGTGKGPSNGGWFVNDHGKWSSIIPDPDRLDIGETTDLTDDGTYLYSTDARGNVLRSSDPTDPSTWELFHTVADGLPAESITFHGSDLFVGTRGKGADSGNGHLYHYDADTDTWTEYTPPSIGYISPGHDVGARSLKFAHIPGFYEAKVLVPVLSAEPRQSALYHFDPSAETWSRRMFFPDQAIGPIRSLSLKTNWPSFLMCVHESGTRPRVSEVWASSNGVNGWRQALKHPLGVIGDIEVYLGRLWVVSMQETKYGRNTASQQQATVLSVPPQEVTENQQRTPTQKPHYLWDGASIGAGDNSPAVYMEPYDEITIDFTSDTSGDLTVEADALGDDDWEDYITKTGTTGEFLTVDEHFVRIRLRFSVAATVTAKVLQR